MKLVIITILAALSLVAQTPPGGGKVSAIVGPRGDTLPSTCSIGQLWQRTGATNPGLYSCGAVNTWSLIGGTVATGDVVGVASSVDGEIALFNGTGGKTIKRATGTGIPYLTSGVLATDSGLQFNSTTKALGVFGPITSGQTSNYLGKLLLNGITSGTVTVQPADAAGTWSMTLPTGAGSNGQVLTTNGSGVTSWTTVTGGGGGTYTAGAGLSLVGSEFAVDTTTTPQKNTAGTFTAKQIFELIGITPSTAPGTPTSGQFYVDSTALVPGMYNGSAWKFLATNPGTTTGDLFYCSDTATPCALTRLAAGTSGYFLRANGAGAAPSYAIPTAAQVSGAFDLAGTNTITGSYDASGATITKPIKSGTSAPGTCGVGELFYDTDATAGQNLFGCTATNTWTQLGGSGGGTGTKLVDSNGVDAVLTGATASAVNQVTVTNAATGTDPIISATGTDTNIGLKVKSKGSGGIGLYAGSTLTVTIDGSGVHPGNDAAMMVLNSSKLSVNSGFEMKWDANSSRYEWDGTDLRIRRGAAGILDVDSGTNGAYRDIRVRDAIITGTVPSASTDACTAGMIRTDASYIYVCTGTNTWKRAALTTF